MPNREGLRLPKREGLRLPQRKGARLDNSSIIWAQGWSDAERLPQRNGVARTKRSKPSSSVSSDLLPHLRFAKIFDKKIQNCNLAIFYLSGASRRSRRWSRFPHRSGLARRTKFAWSSSSKAASFALVIDRQHAKAKVVAAPHQMRLFLIFDLELNLLTGPKRGEQRVKQVSLCVPPFMYNNSLPLLSSF